MQTEIKIIGRINTNKNVYFCNYNPLLQKTITNWEGVPGCIKIIKGMVFIHFTSLGYFTELLANQKLKFSVITTLN